VLHPHTHEQIPAVSLTDFLYLLPRSHGYFPWVPDGSPAPPVSEATHITKIALQLADLVSLLGVREDLFVMGPVARAVAAKLTASAAERHHASAPP
jgi:hypothetical protein